MSYFWKKIVKISERWELCPQTSIAPPHCYSHLLSV